MPSGGSAVQAKSLTARARLPLSPRFASGEVRADRSRPPRASRRRAAAWPRVGGRRGRSTPLRLRRRGTLDPDGILVMRRAARALDPRVPPSVRPPVGLVERDSVPTRVGRPRRDGSLDDGARLLLVAPVDMAADEERSIQSLSMDADADDPSATPRLAHAGRGSVGRSMESWRGKLKSGPGSTLARRMRPENPSRGRT